MTTYYKSNIYLAIVRNIKAGIGEAEMKIIKQIAVTTVLTVLLSGCFGRIQPMYHVMDHPVPASAQNLSEAQLAQTIITAGQKRNWLMEKISTGEIRASQIRKNHVAVVNIIYNSQTFTLKYHSSENLLYSAPNIHRTYNFWLRNLEADIVSELNRVSST